MAGKKGVSTLIATTLLVLITVISIIIISSVLVPFVNKNLKESSSCINVDEIYIVPEFSCYDTNTEKTNVSVKFGNNDVKEIYVVIDVNGNSIINETSQVPARGGGEKVYEFNGIGNVARVGAIIEGKRCPAIDEVELKRCWAVNITFIILFIYLIKFKEVHIIFHYPINFIKCGKVMLF